MASTEFLTELACATASGDRRAADELFAALYSELREIAARLLQRQNRDHTLVPTALVHEAYLKLVDPGRMNPTGTTHFRALAAKAMGQILVDHARGKQRQKRGGSARAADGHANAESEKEAGTPEKTSQKWRRIGLENVFDPGGPVDADLLTLHESLQNMKRLDERLAQVVELRLLGSLTTAETAEVLGISQRSVERDWAMGKAWLRRDLSKE